MRTILITIILILVAAGGWFAGARYGDRFSFESQQLAADRERTTGDTSAAVVPPTIRAQGKIKPAGGLINILAAPGERVASMTEKAVGDSVREGEVLVTLSSRTLRAKDLELAKARRDDALRNFEYERRQGEFKRNSAVLAVEEAKASEQRITEQAAAIELLKKQRVVAQQLMDRLLALQANPTTQSLVNRSDVDKQKLLVQQLELQIEQAQLSVKIARESAERAKESAQNNLKNVEYSLDNAADATPRKTLDAAIALAQQAFDLTEIKCPIDNATIVEIIVRQGDSVTNKPIMVLADLSEINCEAEVIDSYLPLIDLTRHKNLRARIAGNALAQPLMGTIFARGMLIGPVSMESSNPFAKVDQRTGIVTIRLDDSRAAAQLLNLQVEVEIETKPGTLGIAK